MPALYVNLMPKYQDLGYQRSSRPEQPDQRRPNKAARFPHRTEALRDSASAVSPIRFTTGTTGALFDSASETRWGGVVGTGLEFGFAPNWSVAVEYDHLFMGNRDIITTSAGVLARIPAGSIFRTDSIRQDVDIVTARINYRFNWGGPAVPRY